MLCVPGTLCHSVDVTLVMKYYDLSTCTMNGCNICFHAGVALVYVSFFEQVSSSELTNGVINTAFLMLYKVKLCV